MKQDFAHPNDGLEEKRSAAASLYIDPEEDVAVQSDLQYAEINNLVKMFGLTPEKLPPAHDPQFYGDFTGLTDFHTTLQAVRDAEEAFLDLPSQIRERFENDPGQLLEFLNDPNNRSEAVELGLLTAEPQLPRVVVVTPEGSDSGSEPSAAPAAN